MVFFSLNYCYLKNKLYLHVKKRKTLVTTRAVKRLINQLWWNNKVTYNLNERAKIIG